MKAYELRDLLSYEQPSKYIVNSTDYDDSYPIPVLTAGKSFILGYTNDSDNVFDELPVIIFDDFTTATQFVDFKFKVKSSAMKILHVNQELVLPKFIFYKLQTICIDHSTHKRYWIQQYSKIKISIPTIPEQEQIVKQIEESLSQLDSAVETLNKTKQQLEIYRQAVLKEAFDTAISDCRMMSIGDLLTTERKGMTTGPFGTLIKKSDHLTSGVPMLGIENIGRGQFVAGNRIFVSDEKAKELSSFQVFEGDLIISRSGTVGEICPIPKQAKGSLLSTNLIRITLNNRIILNDYFIALFQSKGIVLDQIKELCKGSTRIFLNQSILKRISFPVPTLFKQKRIVDVLSARTEAIKPIETTIDQSLQQAEALRQSILKQAFSMQGEI